MVDDKIPIFKTADFIVSTWEMVTFLPEQQTGDRVAWLTRGASADRLKANELLFNPSLTNYFMKWNRVSRHLKSASSVLPITPPSKLPLVMKVYADLFYNAAGKGCPTPLPSMSISRGSGEVQEALVYLERAGVAERVAETAQLIDWRITQSGIDSSYDVVQATNPENALKGMPDLPLDKMSIVDLLTSLSIRGWDVKEWSSPTTKPNAVFPAPLRCRYEAPRHIWVRTKA